MIIKDENHLMKKNKKYVYFNNESVVSVNAFERCVRYETNKGGMSASFIYINV